jgi:dipeptidyl aminopeptidase/acylaminoacyl peptidase
MAPSIANARFPSPSVQGSADGQLHPLSIHDVVGLQRVGAAVASPDGSQLAYTKQSWDIDSGVSTTSIYLFDLAAWEAAGGGAAAAHTRRLTAQPGSSDGGSMVYSPDGTALAFTSTRSGSSQIWISRLDAPGEIVQISDLPLSVGDLCWTSHGQLFFSCSIFPDLGIVGTAAKEEELAALKASGVDVRSYTELPIRHWDVDLDGKRNHLFCCTITRQDEADGSGWALGEPHDLLEGLDCDCPLRPFGGAEDYSVAPDGASVVYCARPADATDEAWSTNTHLWLLPLDGAAPAAGSAPLCLTEGNLGYDTHPLYSPDGHTLAYLSMETPGYEADTNRLMLLDLSLSQPAAALQPRQLLAAEDVSVSEMVWSPNGMELIAGIERSARVQIDCVSIANDTTTTIVSDHASTGTIALPSGRLVFSQSSLSSPPDLFTCGSGGCEGTACQQITDANGTAMAAVEMGEVGELFCEGAHGDQVQSWLLKPVGFTESKKWPMAVIIHGGPQGAVTDSWNTRWNPQLFAAAGFVTLCVNFHASTGFGAAFREAVSKDWSGAAYEDIIAATEHACEQLPYVDRSRVGAAGASFGGYMINILNGRNDDKRFACLVNHDGIFSTTSMYYTTEETFFPEFEMGGTPFSEDAAVRQRYAEHDPSARVDKWRTPTLVIHGGKDYRLVDGEGIATFTALQRQGVPSELLYFPEENHWVLSRKNSVVWYDKVLGWLDRFLANPAGQGAKL